MNMHHVVLDLAIRLHRAIGQRGHAHATGGETPVEVDQARTRRPVFGFTFEGGGLDDAVGQIKAIQFCGTQ